MANYTHDGPQRLRDATQRSYGALKSSLMRLGTPTSQHNANVTKTRAKKSATKKSAPKPAKQAAAKKTTSKTTAKKAAVKKS